jgi:hypothetical protein
MYQQAFHYIAFQKEGCYIFTMSTVERGPQQPFPVDPKLEAFLNETPGLRQVHIRMKPSTKNFFPRDNLQALFEGENATREEAGKNAVGFRFMSNGRFLAVSANSQFIREHLVNNPNIDEIVLETFEVELNSTLPAIPDEIQQLTRSAVVFVGGENLDPDRNSQKVWRPETSKDLRKRRIGPS